MNSFAYNKTISIGAPVIFLLLSLTITDINNPVLWWVLIMITHTLGYTHFILGYIYQYRSLNKNIDKKQLRIFFGLTIGAILFALLFIFSNQLAILSVIAIGYFIFHGVLNEVTQMKEHLEYAPSRLDMLPLVFYVLSFFLLSLSSPSFFFGSDLVFINPTPEFAITLLNSIVPISVLNIAIFFNIIMFIILLPGRLIFRRRFIAAVLITLISLITFGISFWLGSISYIVLYFLALSYHFISWGIYILQKLQAYAPHRVRAYIWAYVFVLIPFVVSLILLITGEVSAVTTNTFIFNGIIFIIMAMIHNTTSLLNEDWFKKFLHL